MSDVTRLLTGFAVNTALLISLACIYSLLRPYVKRIPATIHGIVTGILFGLIAIIGMLLRIEVAPGVIVDGRVVVVALAGVFGGIGSAVTAGTLVSAYRFWLGGIGAFAGIGVILTATALGAWIHRRWGPRTRQFGIGHFLLLGAALAVAGLLWTLALPDRQLAWRLLQLYVLPVGVFYPLTTLLLGLLLTYLHVERERLTLAQFSLDHSSDAIVWMAPTGRLANVNPAAIRLSGYSRDELLSMSAWDIGISSRDDWPTLWTKLREKGVARFESNFRAQDGTLIPVEVSCDLLEFEGTEYACTVARNITERKRAEAAAEALTQVGWELAGTLDLAQATDRVVSTVLRLFEARRSAIWKLDDSSRSLTCVAVAGNGNPQRWLGKILPLVTLSERAVLEGRPVWSPDALADAGSSVPDWMRENLQAEGFRSVAVVPLIARGKILGTLAIGSVAGRVFTEEELRLLSAFGHQAAIAIQNARLFEASERRRREAESLAEVGRLISESLDPQQVAHRIVDSVLSLLDVQAASLYRLEPNSGELVMLSASGEVWSSLGRGLVLAKGYGIAGLAVSERRPTFTPDLLSDSRIEHTPELRAKLEQAPFRAGLVVPLLVQERIIGALGVGDGVGRSFDDEEIQLLQAFADQAALALENARLYGEAERRRQEAENLADVGRLISKSLNVREVGRRIVEGICTLLGGQSSVLIELETGSGNLVSVNSFGTIQRMFGENAFFPQGTGAAGLSVAKRQPVATSDLLCHPEVTLSPQVKAQIEQTLHRAVLAVPMLAQDRAIGALSIADWTGRVFTDEEIRLAQAFAAQATLALENARLYEEVRVGGERLRSLSHRLVEIQEAERRQIARELHDEVGQTLTGLKLTLETGLRRGVDARRANIGAAQALVNELIGKVRELSLALRPAMLDDLGLVPALLWHFERYTVQTNVHVTFQHNGLDRQRFAPQIETATYRIVQEALTNVARHAGVKETRVLLWADESALYVQVEDQGTGFDLRATQASRLCPGLAGMRERATLLGGHLRLDSTLGAGTQVRAELPLAEPVKNETGI